MNFEFFPKFYNFFTKFFRKKPKRNILDILFRIFSKIIEIRSVEFEIRGGDRQTNKQTTMHSRHHPPHHKLAPLRSAQVASLHSLRE